ncbi:glycosyltransferase [Leptolyngbya sp. AN02str]|uniref:glycosyltransferase n=1 Tax=Leptolyngbya sp. AN02str TaxID=3423363 RepID=UPI003D315587
MLSSTFPYPPSLGGTEMRTFHLARHLGQHHPVTLVTQASPTVSAVDQAQLGKVVAQLVVFPMPLVSYQSGRGWHKLRRYVHSAWLGTPVNVLHRFHPDLASWVEAQVQQQAFDVVTCEHGVNAVYVPRREDWPIPAVLNAHSFGSGWLRNQLAMGASEHPWRDRLTLPIVERYERRFARQFVHAVVTTETDRQQGCALCSELPISVVPNGVDLSLFPRRSHDVEEPRLVFVGAMDADHNVDAMSWFVAEVWPELRSRFSHLELTIVGDRPTSRIQALAQQPGIRVTGRVPLIVDELHHAMACILPLRTGFGIKNKTLEALAAGVPVIGSDRALEGLPVDGPHPLAALRANTQQDYLHAIAMVFSDRSLRQQLSQQGRSLIEQQYTWQQAGQAYEQVLEHAIRAFHQDSSKI